MKRNEILIVGGLGNMGRRYGLILAELFKYFDIKDIENKKQGKRNNDFCYSEYSSIIISTPTNTHFDIFVEIMKNGFKGNIICEKPLSKNIDQVKEMLSYKKLRMVCNYLYAIPVGQCRSEGITSYNYFNHGNDGLYWDCVQLLYLANGEIDIKESSPIWKCIINGLKIHRSMIDLSYFEMLDNFLNNGIIQDNERLIKAHKQAKKLSEV